MENLINKEAFSSEEIMNVFNETLESHVERLLGTRLGIEGLAMNSTTISCLILLASRETEIENFPYQPPPRYTYQTLAEELSGNSIEPGKDLDSQLEFMAEKNYIKQEDDGRYFALKPTISMAQLLDRIFPQMPGLNLIAYLGQVIDEVEAGRKDIESAKNQLNQMLEMQGVPLNQDDKEDKRANKKFRYLKETTPSIKEKPQKARNIKPVNIFSQLEKRTLNISREKSSLATFYSDDHKTAEGTEKDSGDSHQELTSACNLEQPEYGGSENDMAPEVPMVEEENNHDTSDAADDNSSQDFINNEKQTEHDICREKDITQEENQFENSGSYEGKLEVIDDEDIAKKIAAFEEALGMQCPICHIGGIKSETTVKGKLYYHCTNKDCNFISWGKPYYIECPQCKNPFLVEATNTEGKGFLKCARAICHYWQHYPWEMGDDNEEQIQDPNEIKEKKSKTKIRKVRRRRVVRRKR